MHLPKNNLLKVALFGLLITILIVLFNVKGNISTIAEKQGFTRK